MKNSYFIEIREEDYLPFRLVLEAGRNYGRLHEERIIERDAKKMITMLDACFNNDLNAIKKRLTTGLEEKLAKKNGIDLTDIRYNI